MSDSPGLVDFAIRLMNVSDGSDKFFGENPNFRSTVRQ